MNITIKRDSFKESKSPPALYYLNLDERPDRRAQIEEQLSRFSNNVDSFIRVNGKLTPENGMIGCTSSHIRAITHFLVESDHGFALILEDDLEVTANQDEINKAFEIFTDTNNNIDCLLLAYSIRVATPHSPKLIKVLSSFGCAAYLITRTFGYKLLKRFLLSHELVDRYRKSVPRDTANALWGNDVLWCELQASSNVYAFNPRIGKQRRSYSNIQNEITDYGL
jgi:hypothetical protein